MLMVGALFIVLLGAGVLLGEIDWRGLAIVVLTAGAALGAFALFDWPFVWFVAVLAGLDVILVLWIFKGNLSIR